MAKKGRNGAGPRSRTAETNITIKKVIANTSPVRRYGKNGKVYSHNKETVIISFKDRDKVSIPDFEGCPIK